MFQPMQGTNTQKLQAVQLQFANEVGRLRMEISEKHNEVVSLVSQLKDAQEKLKSQDHTNDEVQKLKRQLAEKEAQE